MGPGGGCWAYALTARDVFLDPQMVDAGYWRWSSPHPALPGVEGIPLTNFVGWLLVSALMVAVLSVVIGRREPASMTDRRAAELLPLVAYLWVYASSVIAHLVWCRTCLNVLRILAALHRSHSKGSPPCPSPTTSATSKSKQSS